jgi:DNA-directed RNA polymerase specialized sigma24 family protein
MTADPERWALDAAGFEKLLAFLDPDRDAAAEKYEDIRRRLVKLLQWRGCSSADDYADRAIDRVARRLVDGAPIEVRDPYQYFHGVAANILREYWREPARTAASEPPADIAMEVDEARAEDQAELERYLARLDICLDELVPAQRRLLLAYHQGSGQIARRQALARELQIPINALRIRVHRIRMAVESCVRGGLAGARPETNSRSAH